MKFFTPPVKIHHQGQATALDRLHGFSITGNSAAMRQQMLDDVFILQDMALLGQWTTLYASPNTGKTLITLSISSLRSPSTAAHDSTHGYYDILLLLR